MKTTEFNYWLRGYFELTSSSDNKLSYDQVKIIQNHIKLADKKSNFMAWLEGVLMVYNFLGPEQRTDITLEIKNKNLELFDNVTGKMPDEIEALITPKAMIPKSRTCSGTNKLIC